jgi:hypothetical protein
LALRGAWLGLTLLVAVLAGVTGGILSWLGGINIPQAIIAGAAAFAGTTALILSMARFLLEGR